MLNIGLRSTLSQAVPQLRVEAHLVDFEGEIYGQELEAEFVEKLRDERRFGSMDELRGQIAKDIALAQASF